MKGVPPNEVMPDKTMVPTLGSKYGDYEPARDQTPCFPPELRRPIPVETAGGKESANRALSTLHINVVLEELHFVTLWRCLNSAIRMAKMRTQTVPEVKRAEKVCIRAYHYLASHIMAKHEDDYEQARRARVAAYKVHVDKCAKKGTAPASEDPRVPIAP